MHMINNQLFTFIRPFFISRWGWATSNNDILEQHINIATQDLWDFTRWNFTIANEVLTSEVSWDYLKWNTSFPIDSIIDIEDENWKPLNMTTWRITNTWYTPPVTLDAEARMDDDGTDCQQWHDFILSRNDITKIYVRYYKQYNWIEFKKDWASEMQIPNKFIPALLNKIYDLASPLSYFEDDSVVPRYQIALRQLTELKANDWSTADTYFMPSKWF